VTILDRQGVDAISMRTLADELHTAATSLYRHVHNKGELLDLVVDALMAEVKLPQHGLESRACMRTV
jgi:AcrR family transcriptional regulator